MRRVNQRKVRFLPDAAGAALEGRALLSTFTVTNTDDTGTGSLRNAVALANAHNGTDSIRFQSGLTGVISLDSGQLDLTDNVNILGPGARKIALTNPDGRIFETHDVKATIAALSFLGGHADNGGAILQDRGDLTVKDAVFVRNHADNNGGAIDNVGGTFTGRNDRFVANDAGGFGGAFANERGSRTKDDVSSYGLDSKGKDKGHRPRPTPVTTAAFTDSSFVGNNAYDGGALANLDGSSLSVARGSLVLNRSEADGGGIFSGRGDRSKSIDAPDDATDSTDVAAMTDEASLADPSSKGHRPSPRQGRLDVSDTEFLANVAGGLGGGIATRDRTTLRNDDFDFNIADNGGALFAINRFLSESGDSLLGNTAPERDLV